MVDQPFINSEIYHSEFSAFFAIHLSSISVIKEHDPDFARKLLNQQSDFIATLVGLGYDEAAELRFVCIPDNNAPFRGNIRIAIRVKVVADSEQQARKEALELYQSFMPNVLSISSYYQWQPIQSEELYNEIFCEDEGWFVRELVRREQNIALIPELDAPNSSSIGFTQDSTITENRKNDGIAYLYFPYLRNYDSFQGLFVELLYQKHPTILSIRLDPTRATDDEYKFIRDQLLETERYMQLPVHGAINEPDKFYPSFKLQAQDVGQHIRYILNVLRDEVFMTTVHIMSTQSPSQMLCESIGVSITEHIHSADPESDLMNSSARALFIGGYEWLEPKTDKVNIESIEKIRIMEESYLENGLLNKELRVRRLFDINQASCVFRLPIPITEEFPGLENQKIVSLAPPITESGVLIGSNEFQSSEEKIYMHDIDRLRHTYIIGKTGTGKSTYLKNLIVQDILNNKGVGVFDPHGELIEDIMPLIPPERTKDVVLIDPEYFERSVGLNILDVDSDLEKESVTNYLIEVFGMLFDMKTAGGPVFEQYFRNAMLLLFSGSGDKPTLLDLNRIFEDVEYRTKKIEACVDPQLKLFWKNAIKTSGDVSLTNISNYICSKLVRLVAAHSIKTICCQKNSTVDLSDIIENQKVLLVNLSKGVLGDTSSHFLGMMIIKLIQTHVFRREKKSSDKAIMPFYLYVDEFQNLATPTFTNLLSESRKYGLGMTLANQYLNQIPAEIRDSITGNVGTMVSFRLGTEDASKMESFYAPYLSKHSFINLPNYHAYVSMLVNGDVCKPFNIKTENMQFKPHKDSRKNIYKNMTSYTRLSKEIMKEIYERYNHETIIRH